MHLRLWSVGAVLLGAVGCAGPESVSRHQLGDTTFVHAAEPLYGTATLREVLRIGVLEGEPEYMFAQLGGLAVSRTGDVFVVELAGEIRHYDSEGTFVRTVAREGQGPGEVGYVIGMDVADDGRLAVVDLGNQRITVYSAAGEFIRQVRRPPGRPAYGRGAVLWDKNGELWVSVHPPRAGRDTLRSGDPRPIYARLVSDATVVDTVFLPQRATDGCLRRHPSYARGYWEDSRIAFFPFAHWDRDRDGTLAFGCPAQYSFDVVSSDGSVTRSSRVWEPVEMKDAEYEFWTEWVDEVGRERPAYLRLWVAEDGRVWAWRGTAGHSRESTAKERELGLPPIQWEYWSRTDGFDVFDEDGQWLGHVKTPSTWGARPYPGSSDPFIRGDTIWSITLDEFEVSYVSKFVVEWPERRPGEED